MVYLGIIGMALGPLVQQMHLVDWWQPHFVFDTAIKFEDLLFGFVATGTAVSLYTCIRTFFSAPQLKTSKLFKIALAGATFFAVFGLFYWFGVHSFVSSVIGFCLSLLAVSVLRPSLFIPLVITGFCLALIAFPGYLFGIYLNPTWVQTEWLLASLSGHLFSGIPIEELLWFFFAGAGLGAFQEIFIFSKRPHVLK